MSSAHFFTETTICRCGTYTRIRKAIRDGAERR